MARFLICTHPITGHVNPAIEIVRKLVERGHEVRVYTGQKFKAKVEAAGVTFQPMVKAYDYDDSDYDKAFPGRAALKGINQIKFDFTEVFVRRAPEQVADLRAIFQTWTPDVVLCDPAFAGARFLYELGEIEAFAVFNISVLGLPSKDVPPFGLGLLPDYSPIGMLKNKALAFMASNVVFKEVNAALKEERAKFGLKPEPFSPVYSDMLYLQPSVPAIEYPRTDLIPSAHFIGALIPQFKGEFEPPVWWDEVTGATKPVVLVTQGTVATNAEELILPALQALAHEDVLVVATTGGKALAGPVPANARVAPFIPFNRLMPHVRVMVTNGGYGGVTIALANGVPVVCGGTTEDKPEVGNRVAYAGVGINLKTNTPLPEQIRAAVKQVLDDSTFRDKAKRLQAEYARHDGPTEAAVLLEKLATTKQPVLNAQPPFATAACAGKATLPA
ncbi:MAG: glycosyl transferase [Candidatus Roseilinea sp.]|nr:MAG: glycosyl transferase [Candidatus Roseilinea sp.]